MRPVSLDERPGAGPRLARRRWLVALVALVLTLTLADRLLVGVIERHLSQRLSCVGAMRGAHTIRIHGFPFLTQVVTGHYSEVTVSATSIGSPARLTDVDASFHDLRLPPLAGLLGKPPPRSITVGSIVVTATVPASAGPLALLLDAASTNDRLRSVISLQLPFPARVDVLGPVPGGIRVRLTASGGSASGTIQNARCGR
jgi:hypothetical protein